ncbi:MAG: hypothetical protein P9L94_03605 [Candidatus Hinthialibacter antarcticus]|nr:hypothetical protein [Candidatus Hinthialibacter antarcticus]
MSIAVNVCVTVIGLIAVIYAFNSERFRFNILNHLPGPLGERKVVFIIGFAIMLLSFGLAYIIGPLHGLVGVLGGWLMLLGSVEWFNLRIVRKLFAPVENKVIRITMFSGAIITILSTGFLFFPPAFSPGGFLMGVSVTILAGRLWWNEDLGYLSHTAKQSKRDYF